MKIQSFVYLFLLAYDDGTDAFTTATINNNKNSNKSSSPTSPSKSLPLSLARSNHEEQPQDDIGHMKNIDSSSSSNNKSNNSKNNSRRRQLLVGGVKYMTTAATATTIGAGAISSSFLFPSPAYAGIDPSLLKNLPVEGDSSGATMRLRQIESDRIRPEDTMDVPYTELNEGVKYREYREGKGDVTIQAGSKVAVEMTIRCQSFSTAQEPGGVKYFSTKEDTDFNEYAFTVGSGQFIPEVEEAMMGMKKGGLRRIIVPSVQVFSARKANQLPLPTTKDGQRRFENLFKTDATLLFEVLVTRIK